MPSTIREQHRLRKQGAEKSRTQPIVVRFAGREREMDRLIAMLSSPRHCDSMGIEVKGTIALDWHITVCCTRISH
jgi:hypothetical protein